ncbi:MAG: hypothetical protein PHW63_02970 [Alphaproteobacteria bacterium]|nr:hypothetical protein [Alphaproteobacteria bacterium]
MKSTVFPECSDHTIGAYMQNFARTSPKSGGKVGEGLSHDFVLCLFPEKESKMPQIENRLRKLDTELSLLVEEVLRIRNYTAPVVLEQFYEPVSVLDAKGKKKTLINFTPEMLNAWICHSSQASFIKMKELEEGILSEICEGRLLSAMTLIRSHFEAAGMACLCIDELNKWFQTDDSSVLRDIIPITFLGTSLVRASKKFSPLEDGLLFSEQDKMPTSKLISAIDAFVSSKEPTGKMHSYYGFLCEFTHPNLRALRDYIKTEMHEIEGWIHKYKSKADLTKKHYGMMLDVLLTSMKAGHASCAMLREIRITEQDGNVLVHGPDEPQLKEIWENLYFFPEELNERLKTIFSYQN